MEIQSEKERDKEIENERVCVKKQRMVVSDEWDWIIENMWERNGVKTESKCRKIE